MRKLHHNPYFQHHVADRRIGRNCPELNRGFTLAELLIALAILGVIATFTIPKILQAQQSQRNNALAKEVISTISQAYQQHKLNGRLSATTKPSDLMQYLNYVALDTSGAQIDDTPTFGADTCDSATPCVKLHNGGKLWFNDMCNYSGTATTNFIEFLFDPDGTYSNSTADSPGKGVEFEIFYDGFITSRANLKANSYFGCGGPFGPYAPYDPSWFQWK